MPRPIKSNDEGVGAHHPGAPSSSHLPPPHGSAGGPSAAAAAAYAAYHVASGGGHLPPSHANAHHGHGQHSHLLHRAGGAAGAAGQHPPGIALTYSRSYDADEQHQAAAAHVGGGGGYYVRAGQQGPMNGPSSSGLAGRGVVGVGGQQQGQGYLREEYPREGYPPPGAAGAGGGGPIHRSASYDHHYPPLPRGQNPAAAAAAAFHLPPGAYYGGPPIPTSRTRSFSGGSSAAGGTGEMEQHQPPPHPGGVYHNPPPQYRYVAYPPPQPAGGQYSRPPPPQQPPQDAGVASSDHGGSDAGTSLISAANHLSTNSNSHGSRTASGPSGSVGAGSAAAASAAASASAATGLHRNPPPLASENQLARMSHAHAASLLVQNLSAEQLQHQIQRQQQQYQLYQRPPVAPPAVKRATSEGSAAAVAAEQQAARAKAEQSSPMTSGSPLSTTTATNKAKLQQQQQQIETRSNTAKPAMKAPAARKSTTTTNGGDNDKSNPAAARCTCKKSKCLKLYCQCFAAKSMCTSSCRCMVCMNTPSNEKARTDAIRSILSRNPSAFDDKFAKAATDGSGTKGGTKTEHKVGCKCRKSACLKKYCECYHAGVKCSYNCRCSGCKNTEDGKNGNGGAAAAAAAKSTVSTTAAPAAAAAMRLSSPVRTSRPFAHDAAVAKPAIDKTKGSPGDPWVIEDAAKNLAFLKAGSPLREEKKSQVSSIPDISAMPSLTSSEEVSPFDHEKQETPAAARPTLGKQPTPGSSDPQSQMQSDVISPNTESKAGTVVDALLLAASALTELNGSVPNPVSTPSRQPKKEVIEGPQGGSETPQRNAPKQSTRSPMVMRSSPKRKSSFGSDCPTPKKHPSFESMEGAGSSPDAMGNRRKNARDVVNASATTLLVDSRSDAGDQDSSRPAGPNGCLPKNQPFTPPIPPKLKKCRLGSLKKADRSDGNPFANINGAGAAKETPPRPPTCAGTIDSAARQSKMQVDSDMDDASSVGSSGSNGDSSDNQDTANARDVFRDRASTPPGRPAGEALTPVSSRIIGLRKLDVNDSIDVAGDIGMDVELERKT